MILHFIMTDQEWKNGTCLEEYNGTISIARAYEGNDGEAHPKWGYPEKNREPISKSIPWKVELGDKAQAIGVLKTFLGVLEAEEGEQAGSPVDDLDIPF